MSTQSLMHDLNPHFSNMHSPEPAHVSQTSVTSIREHIRDALVAARQMGFLVEVSLAPATPETSCSEYHIDVREARPDDAVIAHDLHPASHA
ncbi:hypothetical protein PQR34_46335 [Paraburkholderia sediminicola]|uniref:hypothetical protein n=1 Tax=Paraburkholderia sediminicola TaxID=458836 RepID=UPI0038BA6431